MKYVSLLLVLMLSLTMMTACASEETADPSVVEGQHATPKQSGSEQELQELLASTSSIPVGTMGVSIKFTETTVVWLDWCEATSMTEEQVTASLDAYYQSGIDQTMFVEQIYGVGECMETLADASRRESILADAGLSSSAYAWTQKSLAYGPILKNLASEWTSVPVDDAEVSFRATVLEVFERSILVSPLEGEDERRSADQIDVSLPDDAPAVAVGDTVLIAYDGMIAESYPAQIHNVNNVTVVTE